MPMLDPNERYHRRATMVMLSLALFAAVSATLIHWLGKAHQPMDMIVPPTMGILFAGLLVALIRHPEWTIPIARVALLASALALAAPTWLYTLQATLIPGLQLIVIYPPVSSLLLVLMVMVMLFFPSQLALRVGLSCWVLIALPVLVYLLTHPAELWTPRGRELLMTYGPVVIMLVVLLPVQRGWSGKIKQLVSERERMEFAINRDPLTLIHSRQLGERVLQQILAEQVPAGVIMFDMDRFKAINDTYGHPVGDRVLREAAKCCQDALRANECIARWGGEEFVVIVPNVDALGLQQMAERLRATIARAPVAPVPRISASFGVTMVRSDDALVTVLERVDQALYRAKEQGGDCVVAG